MIDDFKHIDPKSRKMLEEAKEAILSVEPEAEVYLFGSRARGDFNEESDWDLLVLAPGEVGWKRKSAVMDKLYDVELANRACFNLIVDESEAWLKDELLRSTPFHVNVEKDKAPI